MATIKKNNNFFFPPNPNVQRYYYPSTISTYGTQTVSFVNNRIFYMPIYISKYVINPNFCMEITSITSSVTVQVGIYSSVNGLINAPLLWKGNIVGSSIGISKVSSNISLKEDWYILASTFTSISTSTTFRVAATNYFRVLFGESTSIGITGGLASSHYYEDLVGGVPNNISSSVALVLSHTTPVIALEY